MTKRVHIKGAHDHDEYIIGIASDERIWKLCYELNKMLSINMLESEVLPPESASKEEADKKNEDLLFEAKSFEPVKRPLRYYEDANSVRGREFALFAAESADLPKTVRAFRYFLLLRAIDSPPPDLPALVAQINESGLIRSAVDISNVKNIKSLIP